MIGEKITPILVEIEETLWEYEANVGNKPNYPEKALPAATKIFMSVLMDKIFELQEDESIDIEIRMDMAEKAGEDIRNLIKTYANLDTKDFYK